METNALFYWNKYLLFIYLSKGRNPNYNFYKYASVYIPLWGVIASEAAKATENTNTNTTGISVQK